MKAENKSFDIEARWKGELKVESRKAIKEWINLMGNRAKIESKIGKQRSKISIKFDSEAINKEANNKIDAICNLMTPDPKLAEGLSAIKEISNKNIQLGENKISLIDDIKGIVLREWGAGAVKDLQSLVPQSSLLSVSLGVGLKQVPDFPANKVKLNH